MQGTLRLPSPRRTCYKQPTAVEKIEKRYPFKTSGWTLLED